MPNKPPHHAEADANNPASLATLSDDAFASLGQTLLERAQHGDARACVLLGHWLASERMHNTDPEGVLRLYQRAAKQGDAQGAYFVGGVVLAGKGTDRDPEAAFQYFTDAATRDPAFHPALFAVADCHLRGHGTVQDYAAAREHFQRAADAGSVEALTHLGAIYAEGLGVEKDAVAVLRFLTQAITAGSRNAAAYVQGLEMRSAGKSG